MIIAESAFAICMALLMNNNHVLDYRGNLHEKDSFEGGCAVLSSFFDGT